MNFSIEQKVKCCSWAIAFENEYEAIRRFQQTYPNVVPPSRTSIHKWKTILLETGSIKNSYHRSSNKENEEIACAALLKSPKRPNSLRKVASATGIPKSSVQRYAKKNKINHYKTHLVHGLLEDDPDRRVEFCSKIIEKTDEDAKWYEGIVFSDEATFYRTGSVNRHNCYYYNTQNPHILHEENLKSKGITVWVAVTKDGVLSYDISHQTMTGDRYASILTNHIVPHLSHPEMRDVFFQQDGAPPHYANVAKAVLDQNLPNRWIGRGSSFMDWPPRSPDLSVCDFFLWGFLKEKVYSHTIATDDELMRLIEEELLLISRQFFKNAYDSFLFRCYQCIAIDGHQFE